ncbi:MAG: pyruvate, water dikinase regulatory protein [Pseudomonadota bacterium]
MTEVFHLHLVSDSTGETLHTMARSALAPFGDIEVELHVTVFVRSSADIDAALDQVRATPGLIIFTIADSDHRAHLLAEAQKLSVPVVPALDPVISALSRFLGRSASALPGMQHRVTNAYFERVAALDFAVSYDDGALGDRLLSADVILTGVSRASKTPTCIYLAHRGVKAANVPLVPKQDPDPAFFDAMKAGIPVIGLTASPSRLSQIRAQRLETIGAGKSADYAEIDQIRSEVAEARLFFDRYDIPVIDVTRRSIEETAAEILVILRRLGRFDMDRT